MEKESKFAVSLICGIILTFLLAFVGSSDPRSIVAVGLLAAFDLAVAVKHS